MKPSKEIINQAAITGSLVQRIKALIWSAVIEQDNGHKVDWNDLVFQIIDLVRGAD